MDLHHLLLEAMCLTGVWLCLAVWQRDPHTPGRRTFVLTTLAWLAWCVGDLAMLRGWLPPGAADKLLKLGALSLPPLWLGVAAQTARLPLARRVPWLPAPLLVPATCVFALLFSSRWSGLYVLTTEAGVVAEGPLFAVMKGYNFALAAAASGIFVAAALRWHQPGEASRRLAIGIAPFLTIGGGVLYNTGHWSIGHDPTPLLVGATLLTLHRGIFSGGLLQPLSVSQHALIQQLPLGVILTDRNGVVVDVNPVAERRLGMAASAALGRNFEAVLLACDPDLRFEVSTVMAAGSEAGQIVLFDPPGKQEPRAEALRLPVPSAGAPDPDF